MPHNPTSNSRLALLATTALRVLIYARYSSDAQSEASIDDQLRICRARAEREGWQVVAEFSDAAMTGQRSTRPGFEDLERAVAAGQADIVLTESLDRLSRDTEHLSRFFKNCEFAGIRLITLADGETNVLHVGVRGAMGALYLKDLAEKTRRGEDGRTLQGRAFGAPPYGYGVVRRLGGDGEFDRGLREINPSEAEVVRRIFLTYAAGISPLAIARELNAEGIPGPSGGLWYQASIRGRPTRGDGILRNRLYVGRLIRNRRRNVFHPIAQTKVRRPNPAAAVLDVPVPDLRIIDDMLWDTVQARLEHEAVTPAAESLPPGEGFWNRRRPRYLLTGKVTCGCCGRIYSAVGRDYLGCPSGHEGTCRNRRSIRRSTLQGVVLSALRQDLMHPDLVTGFIASYNAETGRLAREAGAECEALRTNLAAVKRKIDNLVVAISDGLRSPRLQQQLDELEARRVDLEGRLSAVPAPPPTLHPNLGELYRRTVTNLEEALADAQDPEALEALRVLIDRVIVTPADDPDDPPEVEVVGELTAMLAASGVQLPPAARAEPARGDLALFACSVKAASGDRAPWSLLTTSRHRPPSPAPVGFVHCPARSASPGVRCRPRRNPRSDRQWCSPACRPQR